MFPSFTSPMILVFCLVFRLDSASILAQFVLPATALVIRRVFGGNLEEWNHAFYITLGHLLCCRRLFIELNDVRVNYSSGKCPQPILRAWSVDPLFLSVYLAPRGPHVYGHRVAILSVACILFSNRRGHNKFSQRTGRCLSRSDNFVCLKCVKPKWKTMKYPATKMRLYSSSYFQARKPQTGFLGFILNPSVETLR